MEYDNEDDIIYLKQRKVRHWAVLFFFLLILLAALKVRITNVTVLGNETYTAEQAEALIFSDYWDRNTVLCIFNSVTGRKKDLPFVEDYEIVLKSPVSCELRFYEKSPVGCIKYMSSYMYFDKDGIMIESSDRQLDGVPVVEGIAFGHIVLGEKLPVDSSIILNSIMNTTQQMALYDIQCTVLKYNDTNNTMTAVLDDGDIEVYLGTEDLLEAKISALNDMLPEIRSRELKGTLDLSSYSDTEKGSMSSFKLRKEDDGSAAASGGQSDPAGQSAGEHAVEETTAAEDNA